MALGSNRDSIQGLYNGTYLFIDGRGMSTAPDLDGGRFFAVPRGEDGRLVIPGGIPQPGPQGAGITITQNPMAEKNIPGSRSADKKAPASVELRTNPALRSACSGLAPRIAVAGETVVGVEVADGAVAWGFHDAADGFSLRCRRGVEDVVEELRFDTQADDATAHHESRDLTAVDHRGRH